MAVVVLVLLPVRLTQADGRPAALSWARGDGASECASIRDVARAVASRLARDPWVSTTQAQLFFDAQVERTSSGYRARIVIEDEVTGERGEREVTTDENDCRVLDDTVALILSLMIDPDAAATRADSEEEPTNESNVVAELPVRAELSAPPHNDPTFSFSGGGLATYGYRNRISPGASLRWAWHVHPRLFLELAASLVSSGDGDSIASHGVWLHNYFATPSACAFEFGGRALRLRTCAGVELGGIESFGVGYSENHRLFDPWVAPTISARVRAFVTNKFGVELGLNLAIPIVRPRYAGLTSSGETERLHQVGPIVGSIELALFAIEGP